MQRCPCSVKRMGAISIVDGDVCVNMWATAYALPMWRRTHGAVRVCWHEGSSRGYMHISIYHVISAGTLTNERVS